VVDLKVPQGIAFQHGQMGLTVDETESYLDLLDAIDSRRQAHWSSSPDTAQAEWQKAFYEYASDRRKAWLNGKLPLARELADPFRSAATDTGQAAASRQRFSVIKDLQTYPDDYVGRPVVMYGSFTPVRLRDLQPRILAATGLQPQPIRIMQGELKSQIDGRTLAVVDTRGLHTPDQGLLDLDDWPDDRAIPVLVKGWFVKLWGEYPLIHCESLRLMTEAPYRDLIQQYAVQEERILTTESWLYYETLTQLQQTSPVKQRRLAEATLRQRIDNLMTEIRTQSTQDMTALETAHAQGRMDTEEFQRRKNRLLQMVSQRVARYRRHQKDLSTFESFVDLFRYTDEWQGRLLTMQGHVKHVVSYPSDETLFGGRMLHELWLFTDDSQHIPTVIVTPNLPKDFPTTADVIDRVSVTGCCFKRYVYGSQQHDRVAPLLLAGSVQWQPTEDQVLSLVRSGHLSSGSTWAQNVKSRSDSSLGSAAALVFFAIVILIMMALVGRNQRERRDRRRLLDRVNENPEFENRDLDGYSPGLSDMTTDFDPDEFQL
jgi:hypothetical protein